MLPKLRQGMPSLNIPPLDPYTINGTTFEYKRGEMSAMLTLKTATFYGMTNTEIRDVRTTIDENGMTSEIDAFIPTMRAQGLYKGVGKFNNFKINAKGTFNMTFTNTAVTTKTKGVFETRDGEQYLKIVGYDLIPSIGDLKVEMTGLFPDPELSKRFFDNMFDLVNGRFLFS